MIAIRLVSVFGSEMCIRDRLHEELEELKEHGHHAEHGDKTPEDGGKAEK